jgi:tetratricopeptide (TPR) repeat protein
MNEHKEHNGKYLGIKIGLIVATILFGVSFFVWTAYPNLQITALHKAYKNAIKNADSSYVIDRPFLFEPHTYVQPRSRYLLVTLIVKAYQERVITTESKILPFAIGKLEESVEKSAPYFNAYLYLGKAYDTMALVTKDPKMMEEYFNKGEQNYIKALEIIPDQQTAVISYAINLFDQRQYEKAVGLLRESLSHDDQISELHYYLGQFLFNIDKKNANEALAEIETALNDDYNPDNELTNKTYQGLLFYFAEKKDKDRVVTVLTRLKLTHPEQAEVYGKIIDYIETYNAIPELEAS